MFSHAVIIRDTKFLLVKQFKFGRVFWSFPGGRIEEGESPEQACIREVKEETGYDVKINKLVYQIEDEHYFLIDIIGGDFRLEHKLLDYAWVSKEEHDKWDKVTFPIIQLLVE
jgi:8-oxo-dGTP pyrophosphatase MutT (NUDIX family)